MEALLNLPTQEDKSAIHGVINAFAHGKLGRMDMLRMVANVMGKYNLQTFPVFNYSVRLVKWYKIDPVIIIQGCGKSERCPVCDSSSDHAGYLQTEHDNFNGEHDIITAMCLECGCIYSTEAPNHRYIAK